MADVSVLSDLASIEVSVGNFGGAQILFASGAPSSAVGSNGDVYFNKTNGDVYKKAAGSWTLETNVGTQTEIDAAVSIINTALGDKSDKATTITAGLGLSGGGSLAANRTIDIDFTTVGGDNGTNEEVARGNHIHDGRYYTETESDARFINTNKLGVANGVATLDPDGKIPAVQIPSVSLVDVFTVSSVAGLTALSTAKQGDIGIVNSLGQDYAYILSTADPATLSNWIALSFLPGESVSSVDGQRGAVDLSAIYLKLTPGSAQTVSGVLNLTGNVSFTNAPTIGTGANGNNTVLNQGEIEAKIALAIEASRPNKTFDIIGSNISNTTVQLQSLANKTSGVSTGNTPNQFMVSQTLIPFRTGDAVTTTAGSGVTIPSGLNATTTYYARVFSIDPSAATVPPSSVTNYAVTVPFGTGSGYYLNTVQRPILSFFRGNTYNFNQNDSSNAGHPVGITSIVDDEAGLLTIAQGVKYYLDGALVADFVAYETGFAAATTRKVEFIPNGNTPATVYYFCGHHTLMGNQINVTTYSTGNIDVTTAIPLSRGQASSTLYSNAYGVQLYNTYENAINVGSYTGLITIGTFTTNLVAPDLLYINTNNNFLEFDFDITTAIQSTTSGLQLPGTLLDFPQAHVTVWDGVSKRKVEIETMIEAIDTNADSVLDAARLKVIFAKRPRLGENYRVLVGQYSKVVNT